MQIREDFELLKSLFLGLDPLEDGFEEVLLEIHRRGDHSHYGQQNPQVLL